MFCLSLLVTLLEKCHLGFLEMPHVCFTNWCCSTHVLYVYSITFHMCPLRSYCQSCVCCILQSWICSTRIPIIAFKISSFPYLKLLWKICCDALQVRSKYGSKYWTIILFGWCSSSAWSLGYWHQHGHYLHHNILLI